MDSALRSRVATASAVVIITLLCWAWIGPMARDMYGPMTGLSAWMMTSTWDSWHLFLLWLMWAVMMAAMMLPSAMPLLLLYERSSRQRTGITHRHLTVASLGAGYLLVWAGFSLGATVLQRILASALVLNPMMEMTSAVAIGITLILAGGYQLTPWKAVCLRQCRTPVSFVMQRWRSGAAGAMRMGIEHGVFCLGCCWALMLLLFAGGVMNLLVIIGLTLIVLVEKVTPIGEHASRVLGMVLIAAGVWILVI